MNAPGGLARNTSPDSGGPALQGLNLRPPGLTSVVSVSGSQDRRSPWPSSARCTITWISSHGKGGGQGSKAGPSGNTEHSVGSCCASARERG